MNVTPGGGYLYHTSGLDFASGSCDVCKQKNVKVTPFHCKSHYYCRSCLEFAPKFRRSRDFSCPTCCERSKKRTTETLEKVDKFMRTQTDSRPSKNFEEVVFSVGGSSFVSWNNESGGSDEESDLTGNNDEWDSLLETMSRDKQQLQTTFGVQQTTEVQTSPFQKTQTEENAPMVKFITKPGIMGMAPATSYLQLKLPTAENCSSQSSVSSSPASTSGNSQTSSMDIPSKASSILLRANQKNRLSRSVSSVSSGSVSKSSDNDDGDRLEVKGSATVAGRRQPTRWMYDASPENYPDERKKRPNTPVSSRTGSSPEYQNRIGSGTSFECWMEELGAIEGPSFKDNDVTFTSQEKLPEVEKDDFWDM